ncbi:MAG TPA: hypothetical protein VLA64_03830 [Azonexus sp.]|nr:hypothetical protein [Azonexus sp.]
MNIEPGEPEEAAQENLRRAQIEQRLQELFRLAGDSESARQLMRMVIEYRLKQQP